jgi:hypothetical protein
MNRGPHPKTSAIVSIFFVALLATSTQAQLSKVDSILQQYGYQIQASINPGGTFYYSGHTVAGQPVNGFTQANYSTVQWQSSPLFTDSNGVAITAPWSMWVVGATPLPDTVPASQSHLSNLVSLQLGDEDNWESNASVRASYVSQFQSVQANANYNNTILYTNNFLGQVQDDPGNVSDFIQQAHPDMLTFDSYPFNTSNASTPDDSNILNTPFESWYTELRFYRDVTLDNSYQSSNPSYSVEFGTYLQTYATTGDGTRVPSASEIAVQSATAMAFNSKMAMDFTANGSASALYADGNQSATTAFYNTVQLINLHTQNLGRAMVRLTPLVASPIIDQTAGTPDILFLRGQQVTGNPSSPTTPNVLPNGFEPNTTNGSLESNWTPGANDPWLTGFGQANIGKTVNAYVNSSGQTQYATGDALISWFRPIGELQSDATAKGDIYFLIVNALAAPNATQAQCLQDIHLDFTTWPLASGASLPSIQYIDPATGQVVNLLEDQTGLKITNSTIEPDGTVLLTNTNGDPTNHTGKLRLNVFLGGGDEFLFKFNTGAVFAVPEPTSAALIISLAAITLARRPRRRAFCKV